MLRERHGKQGSYLSVQDSYFLQIAAELGKHVVAVGEPSLSLLDDLLTLGSDRKYPKNPHSPDYLEVCTMVIKKLNPMCQRRTNASTRLQCLPCLL